MANKYFFSHSVFLIEHLNAGHQLETLLHPKTENWLICQEKAENHIAIIHFGPLEINVKNVLQSFSRIFSNWLETANHGTKPLLSKFIRNQIEKGQAILDKLNDYKKEIYEELDGLQDKIFGSEIKKQSATAPVLVKGAVKLGVHNLSRELGLLGTKLAAKETTKAGAKSLAKKIPLVSLGVGTAFGLWRLVSDGDTKGAIGEIASGAAACLPGPGTMTSVALDVSLCARDVKNQIDFVKVKTNKLFILTTDGLFIFRQHKLKSRSGLKISNKPRMLDQRLRLCLSPFQISMARSRILS